MRVYLASRFEDRFRLRLYRDQLWELGYRVTSRWLDHEPSVSANDPNVDLHSNAQMDFDDVGDSEIFILFLDDHEQRISGPERGGRHVEFGYKLMQRQLRPDAGHVVIIVGERKNIFHHHKYVDFVVPTWADCLELLRPRLGQQA